MRKRRTRQHILEDLGFNHVEKHILLAGNILRRFSQNDYGYDGMLDTFNENGEADNLSFMIQLKSTDNINFSQSNMAYTLDLSKRDLELWLNSLHPVLIILLDAKKDVAYFVDLQDYFKENRILLKNVRKFVRIYLPQNGIFNEKAVRDLQILFND